MMLPRLDPAPPGPWKALAACVGQSDVMFCAVAGGKRPDERWARPALAICRECPVLNDCRRWALSDPDPATDAVAGGMTPRQRDAARRGIRHGTENAYQWHRCRCDLCCQAHADYRRRERRKAGAA